MFCNSALLRSGNILLTFVFASTVHAQVQNTIAFAQPRHSVSVLDSTREQDGLVGPVRRVKTESAKVEIKQGQVSQGVLELIELTTYGVTGKRVENVSYPVADPQIGKEEYKYDDGGNMTEMTLRDDRGAIISRESYSYEFDAVGNWTKMITSLVLVEDGKIKQEPSETTYRTISYYFSDATAKIFDGPIRNVVVLPAPLSDLTNLEALKLDFTFTSKNTGVTTTPDSIGPAPVLLRRSDSVADAGSIAISKRVSAPTITASQIVKENPETTEARNANTLLNLRKGTTPDIPESNSPSRNTSTANSAVENIRVANPAAAEDSPQSIAFGLYKKGLSYLESGDLQGATEAFLVSLKFAPSAEVYQSLGNAYLKTDKNNSALKAFNEALNLNSNSAEAQYGLGLTSFRLRRYQDARNAFKKATTLQPNMTKAHYGLGLTYLELGQPDAATIEIRILESLDKKLAKQLTAASPERSYTCRFSVCQ